MWHKIQEFFGKNPKKLRVVRTILEYGLCISQDRKIYCGIIEIPYSKIAKALEVDRRVVINTVDLILTDQEMKKFFSKILPAGPSFQEVAKQPDFEFGVVEIYANPKEVGIIARVTDLIAKEEVSIRQILADDPELYPAPKLTIITDKPITDITKKFLEIPGVNSVSIF